MESPVDHVDQDQEGTASPSTSDIENYTRDLLERARARSKLIDGQGQVPPPLKERPPPAAATMSDEMEVEEETQVDDEPEKISVQKKPEPPEEWKSKSLKTSEDDETFRNQRAEPAYAPAGTEQTSTRHARSSRLTMLARTINEWEDDLTRAPTVGHRIVAGDTRSPAVSTPPSARRSVSPVKSPVKIMDKGAMLGGPRSPPKQFNASPPKQVQFNMSPPKQTQVTKSPVKQVQIIKSPPKVMPPVKSPSKASLESKPEGRDPNSVIRPGLVSQHRLLFEPAGGRPSERGPLNIIKGSVQERRMAFEKGSSARPTSPVNVNRPASPVRNELHQEGTRTVNKLFGTSKAQEALSTPIPTPPPPPPAKRPHSPQTMTESISISYPGLSGLKKLRQTPSPPKPGHLYPSLSDIETETETEHEGDPDDSGESLGFVIEKVAKSTTATPVQQAQDRDNTCTVTMAIGSALDALDDALEGEDYTLDTVMESQLHAQASSTPNTAVVSSISEDFGSGYLETDIDAVLGTEESEQSGPKAEGTERSESGSVEDPTITSSPIIRVPAPPAGTTTTPLLHTVSFYRRSQQQQTPSASSSSSSKAAARKQLLIQEEDEDDEGDQERVNEEIRELEAQVAAQTRSIAQASKALNLCSSSMEFSDSTERVECERVLLLATNRRSAILNHIQSLRTAAVLGRPTYHSTATLAIGRMRIQVPRGNSQSNSQMMRIRHYVLMARSGQLVEASEVVQREEEDTSGVLEFKGLRLQGLNKDFRIVLELYSLETGREWLSHDAKYRIVGKKSSALTPSKKQHLHLQSPAGPQAVLSSSFALQGSLTLVIGDLNRKQFQMTTSNSSGWGLALETVLQANATCSIRYSGYLALFEDVKGLGCWVRRWAVLGGGMLQFWMYENDAEDENKPPTTTIPLASITTSTVRPPPPSVCARANSILMESVRERLNSDKPSLTTELSGSITRVKWLLAADSKEERTQWLENLNTVLEEYRRW